MRLFWRVYLWLLAAAMVAFLVAGMHANRSLKRVYRDQVSTELRTQAHWLASELLESEKLSSSEWVDARCKDLGRLTRMRVTVVLPDGTVTGDSDSNPAAMENHGNRPELMAALAGTIGQSERFSDTMRRTLSYLAVPVQRDGEVVAMVRTSMPLATIDRTLFEAYREIAVGVLVVAMLFAVVASILVRRVSRPLDEMRQVAERLADGELDARVEPPSGGPEMRALARALNQMAELLGARLGTITQQRNELKTVFSSMSEGVLAVDSSGRVLNLNSAAEQGLGLRAEQGRGKLLEEAVRQSELQEFIQSVLDSGVDAEADILLEGHRYLHLHGTPLEDGVGRNIGVLVVMSDTTRLRRLEKMRKDFVANVSHELKTPITALRGCVDTLSDPDPQDAGDQGHFIAMMGRQVERLWAIVGDLLSLSRLEHDEQSGRIPLESGSVADVLRRAASSFAAVAEEKQISLVVECPDELTVPINAPLLEQAVGNLIDNAIKYSGDNTRVAVSAAMQDESVVIRVQDEGSGIEQHHLSRLFERFYRVDQARSRALGGTGLGLAIVKHIAQAHGGSVSVHSTPGQGTTFTIRFPDQ